MKIRNNCKFKLFLNYSGVYKEYNSRLLNHLNKTKSVFLNEIKMIKELRKQDINIPVILTGTCIDSDLLLEVWN